MEPLTTHIQPGDPPVLHVRGEIDMATAEAFDLALRGALAADERLVIDMAGVDFVGAAGLRVLQLAAAERNGAGPLRIVHAPLVAKLLDLVDLTDVPGLDVEGARVARG